MFLIRQHGSTTRVPAWSRNQAPGLPAGSHRLFYAGSPEPPAPLALVLDCPMTDS
jgi:hypothetical protein